MLSWITSEEDEQTSRLTSSKRGRERCTNRFNMDGGADRLTDSDARPMDGLMNRKTDGQLAAKTCRSIPRRISSTDR